MSLVLWSVSQKKKKSDTLANTETRVAKEKKRKGSVWGCHATLQMTAAVKHHEQITTHRGSVNSKRRRKEEEKQWSNESFLQLNTLNHLTNASWNVNIMTCRWKTQQHGVRKPGGRCPQSFLGGLRCQPWYLATKAWNMGRWVKRLLLFYYEEFNPSSS